VSFGWVGESGWDVCEEKRGYCAGILLITFPPSCIPMGGCRCGEGDGGCVVGGGVAV
jgi:hypothetical protein